MRSVKIENALTNREGCFWKNIITDIYLTRKECKHELTTKLPNVIAMFTLHRDRLQVTVTHTNAKLQQ